MPTKNPRLNIVLEPALYFAVNKLAHREKMSMSLLSRDLIKEAMEIREDMHWDKVASEREKTFFSKKTLTHKEVWK